MTEAPHAAVRARRARAVRWAALLAVNVFGAFCYIGIKLGLRDADPLTFGGARALIGGGTEGAKEVKASAGRVAKAAKAGAAPSASKAKAAANNVMKRGKATAAKGKTAAKRSAKPRAKKAAS